MKFFSSIKTWLTKRAVLLAAKKGTKSAIKLTQEKGIPALEEWISQPKNQQKIADGVEKAVEKLFENK